MTKAWTAFRWSLAYWISATATALGAWLPTRFWYALTTPTADVVFFLARKKRRILIENLKRVVGEEEAEAAARRVFRNFGRYVIDFYQIPSVGPETLRRRLHFDDWARLDQTVAESKGVVFVTLHLGQHELGAAAVASHGHPVNVIAEKINHGRMNDFIQGLRRKLGMTIIPANKAKPGLLRCLARGEILALLFDVILPGDGVRVDFFGAKAEVSGAPARIALRTGAKVVTTVVCRDPNDPVRIIPLVDFDINYQRTGNDEQDVQDLSQAIATSFESFVRRYPDQWFAFHPVWQTPVTQSENPASGGWRLWSLQLAYRLGRVLPRFVSYGAARLAGDVAFYARPHARADVEANMRQVMGAEASDETISRNAREAFRNVARYYVDLIRLSTASAEHLISKQVRLHGLDRLKDTLSSGRGIVVATAHFGNPEMAVQAGAIEGIDVLVLAEPLPPDFALIMDEVRATFGPRYINVGYTAISESIRHLRRGGCLAIAAERDIQGKGVPVEFFGRPARVPLGAAELAARTGAALMPAYCRRSGDRFDVYFEEPLELIDTGHPKEDAVANTRALLARIETWIASDPGQWMVLERIWKAAPTRVPAPEPAK